MVRGSHKGICHPPSVVLHAYCRWAVTHGIEVDRMRRRWAAAMGGEAWPDGWLADVPVLEKRRGNAPATVAALSRIKDPYDRIATTSRGCHALTRTLPVAVAGIAWARQAGEFAALTHGDSAAQSAAAQAAVLVHHCLTNPPQKHDAIDRSDRAVREAIEAGIAALPPLGGAGDRRRARPSHGGIPARCRPTCAGAAAGPARTGCDGTLCSARRDLRSGFVSPAALSSGVPWTSPRARRTRAVTRTGRGPFPLQSLRRGRGVDLHVRRSPRFTEDRCRGRGGG
ncbi:ADP-ribosylglycohydrolase family protein [Streptomyces sp. NPDC056983]|uniref:ADP-ribosylglycohydrolase family protein n=1 Tax=Streptomyces sp. NPDC056983 TaxID=3345987 RepID=UPI0036352306